MPVHDGSPSAVQRNAEKLLEALKRCGPSWHSRQAIAAQLDKPRLSSYDAAALELLVHEGRIEAERHTIEGPIPVRWEYRVKEET